jgi:hypothetical protein
VQIDGDLTYDAYVEALKAGRGYVSEGRAHLTDFSVNGVAMGTSGSEVRLDGAGTIQVTVNASAFLPAEQDEAGALIASLPMSEQPYWHVERSRVGTSRTVPVELVVNGEAVARQEIQADGGWNDLTFDYELDQSSWVALRIYPSAHTNPIFVTVEDEPIRLADSINWMRQAVDQCWKMKVGRIRSDDQPAAEAAYDKARALYEKLMSEAN